MAQVTSPIILDSTGQQIHSDLQQIKTVLTTPSAAEDITFDNTGTGMQADDVQDAITELKSNLTEIDDWDSIKFTGTYSGFLVGKYNSKIKVAIIMYNSQTATSNYSLTMNVTPTVGMYGALRSGGYLEVGADGRLSIINNSQYSVGQVVFIID